MITVPEMFYFPIQVLAGRKVAFFQKIVDHSLKSHSATIVRMINACNTVFKKFVDLRRKDSSATAAKNFDMTTPSFLQQVIHVSEIFIVTTLITGDGNSVGVFLYGAIDDFLHAPVMSEMDDLGTRALH